MTPQERNEELLRYIAERITLISQYTADGEDAFRRQPMIQDAVLRRLETLVDAASHLSDELKVRHPEIPWREIDGFRNVAAHGYLALDLRRVWTTVQDYLPALQSVVAEELKSFED